jgi:hypothetical protein
MQRHLASVVIVSLGALAAGATYAQNSRILCKAEGEVQRLVVSPDGKRFATGGRRSPIQIWDAATGKELVRLAVDAHEWAGVNDLAFTENGRFLAATWYRQYNSNLATVGVWDAETGQETGTHDIQSWGGLAVLAGRDAVVCWVGTRGGTATLHFPLGRPAGPAKDAVRATVLPLEGVPWVSRLARCPRTGTLTVAVAGDYTGSARVGLLEGGALTPSLSLTGGVTELCLASDGKLLAAGTPQGTIAIWDVSKRQARPPLVGPPGHVLGLAFSPDGKTLASCHRDGQIRLWDVATGSTRLALEGQGSVRAEQVGFALSGALLLCGGRGHGAVRAWDLGQATPTAEAARGKAPATDIACIYRFYNVQDEQELRPVAQTIRDHAKNEHVLESTGRDDKGMYRQYSFAITSADKIAELSATLPFRATTVDGKTVAKLVYEELDARFQTHFRTVTITGTVEVLVRFRITPKASLFYSVEPGKEVSVPQAQVAPDGGVTLSVRVPRTQQFVYGRSVLGQVERFLRINVETGQAEEIERGAYLKR